MNFFLNILLIIVSILFIIIFFIFAILVMNYKKILNKIGLYIKFFNTLSNVEEKISTLIEKTNFLHYEIAKINEKRRMDLLLNPPKKTIFFSNDLESFNFQWSHYNQGSLLLSDSNFKKNLHNTLMQYFDEDKKYFKNKKIIDIGAGSGRFTYGLLSLGAYVTAIEPTKGGCKQIANACKEYTNNLQILQKNILTDDLPNNFDSVFCFGVVHHTGNTYLAIKKACECAKNGAKVFFMIYGYPDSKEEFAEINQYEYWRKKLRNFTNDQKINVLKKHFSKDLVHTLFDASSPKENDLLRYEEIIEILQNFGISNIKRTLDNRNLHLIGYKN